MQTSLFNYHLPENRIAQRPMVPREQAKLLVVDTKSDRLEDRHIFDLPSLLRPDDLLIFNDSKVFKARLRAKTPNGKDVEIFLLRPEGKTWLALAKPGKDLKIGESLRLAEMDVRVQDKKSDGTVVLDFGKTADEVFTLCDELGEVPLPPYINVGARSPRPGGMVEGGKTPPLREYQTVYAKETGSVAAPTAGFHFTQELLKQLDQKGVRRAFVTLHVGLGTFRPMKSETLEEHEMHEEWASVAPETIKAMEETRKRGGRIIAVGTTTVRALESLCHSRKNGNPVPNKQSMTNLFITPGYQFKTIDGLITNFHLPKSTLIVLVSAFAAFRRGGETDEGRQLILKAYQHAIENNYRFYSFGDAMFVE